MKLEAQRGNERAEWNKEKQQFDGNTNLVRDLNALVLSHTKIGSNSYTAAVIEMPDLGIAVLKYEADAPDVNILDN